MTQIDEASIRAAARECVSSMVGRPLKQGETLISSGLIDSLSVLRLIADLEKRLTVTLDAGALQPDDFDDIDLIVMAVQRAARQ